MKLVLLHGFLGAPADWDSVIQHLGNNFECYPLPLPSTLEEFPKILDAYGIDKCILAGYSMGGRVALQLQQKYGDHIEKLILLSSHFGLKEDSKKEKRWDEDCQLAKKLETLPIEEFLAAWYAQPLFAGFSIPQSRFHVDKIYHSALLKTYSLGKQTFLSPPENSLLLYGENDIKYRSLYKSFPQAHAIKDAGHAIHLQNPKAVAAYIAHA